MEMSKEGLYMMAPDFQKMEAANISSTAEVRIPSDPLLQIIGQDEAVKIGRMVG